MKINPGDVRAVTGTARCYAAMGKTEEAEAMLLSIVDPTATVHVPAYVALADIQRRLGKTAEAIESYNKITQFYGYERDAYVALAELYQESGDTESAIRTLERAAAYFPQGDPTIRNWIANLRSRR